MKKADFDLPLLEFCSLERATRLIGSGCEVEDLLHWGELGAIRLATRLPFGAYNDASICISGESKEEIINKIKKMDIMNVGSYNLPGACSFNLERELDEHIDKARSSEKEIVLNECSINGVWDIEYIFDIEEGGVVCRDFTLSAECEDLNLYVEYDEYLIDRKDLLITKKYIEKISGKKGRSIGIQPHLNNKNVTMRKNSYTVMDNKKNKLIKALIEISYGKGSSEKPRSLLNENRGTGDLLLDLQKMGIQPPISGSTLAEYLKDVELDYVQIPTVDV